MLDEILEVEKGTREEGMNIEVDERHVQDFSIDEYMPYIEELSLPEDVQDQLIEVLQNRRPGWQIRARWLVRAKRGYESYERNMQALLQRVTAPPRPRGKIVTLRQMPVWDAMRVSLRVSLRRLSEEQLREVSEQKSVSYDSFMRTNDKEGLIESILDEMLRS